MDVDDEKVLFTVKNISEQTENLNNSVELIRKSSQIETIDESWEPPPYLASSNDQKINCDTPPFVSIMITDDHPGEGNLTDSSTQTEHFETLPNCSIADMSLSFNKDFNTQESTSNEPSEHSSSYNYKRNRRDSHDDASSRPWKRKCTESNTSSTSDLTENKQMVKASSSCQLLSNSEESFKSVNSSHSVKVRKRRMKSETTLLREAMQRSQKSAILSRHNYSDTSSVGELLNIDYPPN